MRILLDTCAFLCQLPDYHKDPFDRMLICQAMAQDLTILTNDAFIQQYPVKTLW
jgi:PIN domain nuclease of toxin-antitoxin system